MNTSPLNRTLAATCALGAVLLIPGCAVGPSYHRPAALGTNAVPAAFSESPNTNFGAWKTAEPSAHLPRGAWWELFGDAELNRLETLATAGNQELAATLANLDQARGLSRVARADLFPQFSAGASYTRQRTSANSLNGHSVTYNTFSLPLEATWELDLWGKVRRTVEGAKARLTAAADDVEAIKLTIQAEVATDYFTLQALQAQAILLQETIKAYEHSLELTKSRQQSGIATGFLDVSQAETVLKSAEAQLPVIELQSLNLRHALATLCGQSASTFAFSPILQSLSQAPPAIPATVPSELLEHRPDVSAAERRMAAANADVGVATAAFFPAVTLSGLAGFQSIDASTFFDWPSRVWSVGPSLQLPLFTGGRNRAQLAAARAAYDNTVANYRQTVLNAFQEVEDQLAAQRLLTRELAAETAAMQAARRTLDISLTRYKGGVITYLEVAIAQSNALSHNETVVQLSGLRQAATVALIKALGGGWSADEKPANAEKK